MSVKNSSKEVPLPVMEKVAWVEIWVSLVTVGVVLSLIPWLGEKASGAFALPAFGCMGLWFSRKRKGVILMDERDQEIIERSRLLGAEVTWMFLVVTLIVILMWLGRIESVSVMSLLNWLIWIQFVVWSVTRSIVIILSYRKPQYAS